VPPQPQAGGDKKKEPPVDPLKAMKDRAMLKAKLIERLRRRKIFCKKDPEYKDLCTYEETELVGLTLEKLTELDSIITTRIATDGTIRFYSRAMVFTVGAVEALSKNYPSLFGEVDLDGWANNLMMEKDQFDADLFEIYDEYGSIGPKNPIAMLGLHLSLHGAMYARARAMTKMAQAQLQQQQQRSSVPPQAQAQQPQEPSGDEKSFPPPSQVSGPAALYGEMPPPPPPPAAPMDEMEMARMAAHQEGGAAAAAGGGDSVINVALPPGRPRRGGGR
jgi:hypothetical protein